MLIQCTIHSANIFPLRKFVQIDRISSKLPKTRSQATTSIVLLFECETLRATTNKNDKMFVTCMYHYAALHYCIDAKTISAFNMTGMDVIV